MTLTSQLDEARRPPKHNHKLKHSHASKILKLLEASIARSVKSVTDIKTSTNRETLALLYESTIFSNDLQKTVYNLQKIVINTVEDGSSDPELDGAVKQFSQFAYSVQQCFSDDIEILKKQIKENLNSIMPQARRLVEAVEGNINREYIHEVVCVVDDLLFAVQKIELRNKLEDDTPESLALEFIKPKDALIDKLNSCTPINLSVLREFKHSSRQAMKKTIEIVMTIDAMAENYNEDIQNTLMQVSSSIMRHTSVMDACFRVKNDVQMSKSYLVLGVTVVCQEMENLAELLKIKIEDEQVTNNLHNLVLLAIVNEIATTEQVLRNIEYAKVQAHDD